MASQGIDMKDKLSFIAEFWPIVVAIATVTFIFSAIDTTQKAQAQKIEKLEQIKEDITIIKIKIERIDTILDQLNKRK